MFTNNNKTPSKSFLDVSETSTADQREKMDTTEPQQKQNLAIANSEKDEKIAELQRNLEQALQLISNLQNQLAKLQVQKTSYSPINSDAEDELVAEETAWLLPKNKKRKAASSPESSKSPIGTQNKNLIKTTKIPKPPPIVVSNIKNYSEIKNNLQTKNLKFNATMMNNNQLKINVDTESSYRELTKTLEESKREWHSYENKQERPIRVMARYLHPSCDPNEITQELKQRGFKIISAENRLKKTKEGFLKLPLFVLTFEKSEDIKNIFDIQYLCHMKVKIEALRTNKLIPQCKICQRYGHTQNFCHRAPTCVKCAGNHLTTECPKPRNTPAKCSNCAEAHPANYRGCIVAKELQKRRNGVTKSKDQSKKPRIIVSNNVKSGISFAQTTKGKQENFPSTSSQEDNSPVMQMLQNMMEMLNKVSERMDRLEARYTSTVPKNK